MPNIECDISEEERNLFINNLLNRVTLLLALIVVLIVPETCLCTSYFSAEQSV